MYREEYKKDWMKVACFHPVLSFIWEQAAFNVLSQEARVLL